MDDDEVRSYRSRGAMKKGVSKMKKGGGGLFSGMFSAMRSAPMAPTLAPESFHARSAAMEDAMLGDEECEDMPVARSTAYPAMPMSPLARSDIMSPLARSAPMEAKSVKSNVLVEDEIS